MPATVYDAQDYDIWPDASARPPSAMREVIRQVAQDEVTLEDVEDSGLTFAPWFSKFYLAEHRVRARMEAAKVAPPAPAADQEELRQLRARVAKLERMVLGREAVLLKVVGTALGEVHGELDSQIKAIADRAPMPIPLPILDQPDRPQMRYCGLWDRTKAYRPGDLATYNGGGWVAQIGSTGLKPGDGMGWRLAVKSDTAQLRSLVKDEVKRQMGGRAPAHRTVTVR